MKVFKRNAVIITVLLFVGAAVYLNWSYSKKVEDASTAGDSVDVETTSDLSTPEANTLAAESEDEDSAGLFYSEDNSTSTYDEYFAQVRLERQQARDEASATLQTVATTDGASQETVNEALDSMTRIADYTVKEAELENLIRAKGFIDCVVYLSDSGASVTVAAEEGLSQVAVAKITDVIVSETDFSADQLNVIEIK